MIQSVPNILCTLYSYYVCYVCYSFHPETADLYFLKKDIGVAGLSFTRGGFENVVRIL